MGSWVGELGGGGGAWGGVRTWEGGGFCWGLGLGSWMEGGQEGLLREKSVHILFIFCSYFVHILFIFCSYLFIFVHICSYFVHICSYLFIFVHICSYVVHMCSYLFIFVHICSYFSDLKFCPGEGGSAGWWWGLGLGSWVEGGCGEGLQTWVEGGQFYLQGEEGSGGWEGSWGAEKGGWWGGSGGWWGLGLGSWVEGVVGRVTDLGRVSVLFAGGRGGLWGGGGGGRSGVVGGGGLWRLVGTWVGELGGGGRGFAQRDKCS